MFLSRSFALSQFPTTQQLIPNGAKKIYAYVWKAFLCCSLTFLWEKYSEKFLKYNCAPRELNYIFEKFLRRLLSTSHVAFSTWWELRVIAYFTDTNAKTPGQLRIGCLVFLSKERFVCSLDPSQRETPSWHGPGQGKSRAFCIGRRELQFQPCLSLDFLPLLRAPISYPVENVTYIPHSSFTCVEMLC